MCDDGLPLGFTIIYDINGENGPNMLSNCDGITDASTDGGLGMVLSAEQINAGISPDKCITEKSQRAIKDQFLLQVRRNVVQPASPAAVWAASN